MSLPPGVDLCQIPLVPNPSGAPPNFTNPPSRWTVYLAVVMPFASISFTALAIRIWINLKMLGKLHLDDQLCILAFVCLTTYIGVGAASVRNTARHQWDLPVCYFDERYTKLAFALNVVVGPAYWASKAAIIALYIRLFQVEVWLRRTSYITIVLLFLVYWSLIPVSAVYCTPRNGAAWDLILLGSCQQHLLFAGPMQGAVSIAADVFILFLPLPIIVKLNLPFRKKIGVVTVFFVGVLAVIVTCVSMYYRILIHSGKDITWNSPVVLATAAAEGYITVICSCAPAIYSSWNNYFAHSALFVSLRSAFSSVRSTRTGHSELPDKDSYPLSKNSRPAQSSKSHQSFERSLLSEQAPTGRVETVLAPPEQSRDRYGRLGNITKSTRIEQSSNEAAVTTTEYR
ncbi:hypothetical protein PMIN02_012226 [Paraphaeosphaeria minitans]|uniref:Integral membrane protein n=1 Tax=Paraphaeosphaeria minitans TaxID=565426 RepID=A0A9P6GJR4_9PLEO|nr:integral membrane protein [Paraphaeosphaeria minitans]